MKKLALTIALAGIAISSAPASAKVCRTYYRGHYVRCHKAFRPSINLKRKHPIKVVRCRARPGYNVKC